MRTAEEVDAAMNELPADWRWRWCTNEECACMGAVNCSGHHYFLTAGLEPVTLVEHQDWKARHPEFEPPPPILEITPGKFWGDEDFDFGVPAKKKDE